MKALKKTLDLIKPAKLYLLLSLLFLITGIPCLLWLDKSSVSLFFNDRHNIFFDYFFRFVTYIGNGLYAVIIIVIIFRKNIHRIIYGLSSFALSGLVAQLLKYIYDTPRPKAFFAQNIVLNFVPNVDVHMFHSFPSGHTASAFSLFLILAVFFRNKSFQVFCFIMAMCVGISRIYLFQHFFVDVYFGALIGIVFTFVSVWIWNLNGKLNNSAKFNGPLIDLFKKK